MTEPRLGLRIETVVPHEWIEHWKAEQSGMVTQPISTSESETLIHATAIDIDGRGVALRGPSASGKSDLALRLIDSGATLIADDYVELLPRAEGLVLRPPDAIAGRIEVRGVGLLELGWHTDIPLFLVADLVSADKIARLPEPSWCTLCGVSIRQISLAPFEISATAKLRQAVRILSLPI
jgi:serine kinase of HPr protein (carbohydrate metabolism regulator)